MVLTPKVGDAVHYWKSFDHAEADQPNAGTISYVHDDRLVNLSLIGSIGDQYAKQYVQLLQPGDKEPNGEHCEWPASTLVRAHNEHQCKLAKSGKVPRVT